MNHLIQKPFLRSIATLLLLVATSTCAFAQEKKSTESKWRPGTRVFLRKQDATVSESFVKVVNNRGWQGGPIRVGGKTFKHGLGVHADSKLIFNLDKKFERFRVTPGPDDSHHGTIQMKILVDDKVVFDSGPINSKDGSERKKLDISVKDANTLTLLVLKADGKPGGDHASWADAALFREKGKHQPVAKTPQPTSISKSKLQPFLNTYCTDCHGQDEQEADVRFDKMSWKVTNNDNAQRWQDILDQLNSGDMPPDGEVQPDDEELAEVLDSITKSLLVARRRLTDHGGEIKLRRLNRREYSNTIRHLFGFDIKPDDIPEDGEFSSFDTVGEEQLFTSSHFDKYLELGKRIGRKGFSWNKTKRKPVKKRAHHPERGWVKKATKKLAEKDRKMAMKKAGKTWKEMGFKDEGEAAILFSQFNSRAELPRKYLQLPHVNKGIYLNDVYKTIRAREVIDIRGDYKVRIRGGVVGKPDEIRKILKVNNKLGIIGTFKMQGTPDKPDTVEFTVRQPMGHSYLAIDVRENMPDFTENTQRAYLKKIQGQDKDWDPWSSLWVDYIETEGPFYPEQRPFFEQVLFPNRPDDQKSPHINVDSKSRELIEKFATEAFRRRPPKKEFVDALDARFHANRKSGIGYVDAMSEIIGIILASPEFLYVHEASDANSRELDKRELAVRLAYFLWSSPPDDELYAADLLSDPVLAAQVNRMLDSPKSQAFLDGFVSQWAEFDRFDAITVEERDHFRFNEGVRHSAKREVNEFFKTLIKENLSVTNLIDSNFVTINPTLAIHYGIDGVESKNESFQKIALPAESPRGGLMTQAAFLIAGSNGERSSPVIRGALVLEKLLYDKPAPPPPNVPELGSASDKPLTNRQLVKMHQGQAVCASCHRKMDVIGFGLENFDTVGAWRETEWISRKKEVAIDASGTIPGGAAFTNVNELKKLLLEDEAMVVREVTESILAYGLGRTIEFSDANSVDQLLAKVRKDGNGLRTIIREIALSPLFKRK